MQGLPTSSSTSPRPTPPPSPKLQARAQALRRGAADAAAELAAHQAGWKVAGRLFEAGDQAAGGKKYALPETATCASVLRDSDRCLLEITGGPAAKVAKAPKPRAVEEDEDEAEEEAPPGFVAPKAAKGPKVKGGAPERLTKAASEWLRIHFAENNNALAQPKRAEAETLAAQLAVTFPALAHIATVDRVLTCASTYRKEQGLTKKRGTPAAPKGGKAKPAVEEKESDSESEEALPPAKPLSAFKATPGKAGAATPAPAAPEEDSDDSSSDDDEEEEEEAAPVPPLKKSRK